MNILSSERGRKLSLKVLTNQETFPDKDFVGLNEKVAMVENNASERPFLRKGLMNRIGWFTYLRVIYDQIQKHKDEARTEFVILQEFINQLIQKQNVLSINYLINLNLSFQNRPFL
jgi:hypothetical protein